MPTIAEATYPIGANEECPSGDYRNLQLYSSHKTIAQATTLGVLTTPVEIMAHADATGYWYLNLNPTPDDIADKSGAGHHPAWFNANRPSLWTG